MITGALDESKNRKRTGSPQRTGAFPASVAFQVLRFRNRCTSENRASQH